MAAAPAAAKTECIKFDDNRNLHQLEYVQNKSHEIQTEMKQSVQVYQCKKLKLFIKGKITALSISNCEDC